MSLKHHATRCVLRNSHLFQVNKSVVNKEDIKNCQKCFDIYISTNIASNRRLVLILPDKKFEINSCTYNCILKHYLYYK